MNKNHPHTAAAFFGFSLLMFIAGKSSLAHPEAWILFVVVVVAGIGTFIAGFSD